MESVVNIANLSKHYGSHVAVDDVSLNIQQGSIVGLIGPNGAGKTTILKSLLGLTHYQGNIQLFGKNVQSNHEHLLNDICFIADTSILPRWLKVKQAIEYVQGVHPKFDIDKANAFIAKTNINVNSKISELSKGMVTQLHLALIMSINVKLLVLDEPTLGLDILYRKAFYDSLLNDYYDEERTIIITTHQVEEIESLLTDIVFVKNGRIILDEKMENLENRFIEVEVNKQHEDDAKALCPIYQRNILGGSIFMFENPDINTLDSLGKIRQPSIADLFVAKMNINGPQQ